MCCIITHTYIHTHTPPPLQVFFKMFFAICLFGVLNGLLLLPIILSLIGPGRMKITPPAIPEALANRLKTRGKVQASTSPCKVDPNVTVQVQPTKKSGGNQQELDMKNLMKEL